RDGVARLWEADKGKLLHEFKEKDGWVLRVAFSPDGRNLATGNWGSVALWEVATGKERLRLALPHRSALTTAFAPDGRTLATGHGDGTALLWDVTGLRTGPRPGAPTAADLRRWWADLLDPDAPAAFRALWALTAAPDEAVALAGKHLRPV